MNKIRFVLAFAVLLASAGGACAQVNKCTDASGKVSYSEQACTGTQRGGQVLGIEATRMDPARDRISAQLHRESLNRTMQGQREMIDGPPRQASAETDDEAPAPQSARPAAIAEADPTASCDTYSTRAGCIGGRRETNSTWSPREGYYGVDHPGGPPAAAPLAAGPGSLVNCDQAGCWGSANGVRYNRAAGGNLIGTNGSFCTRGAGNNFSCN
jgi:hypothetical protein